MPILAMTLSRPASIALRYRGAASSPAVAKARYGCTAVAPMVTRHATSCTSTTSPAMATMSVDMRRPVASRCECTAPTASAIGTGSRCSAEHGRLQLQQLAFGRDGRVMQAQELAVGAALRLERAVARTLLE